jgi:hypothetical protein
MQTGGWSGSSTPTGTCRAAPPRPEQDCRTGTTEPGRVAELLERVLELDASDLHLTAGARPTVRVNGRLGQLEDFPVLSRPRPGR